MSTLRPFSSRCIRDGDWALIEHFKPREFRNWQAMGWEFIVWLDAVRKRAGVPMVITSDYRTKRHNAAVGGAPDSAHVDVPCNAVDIGERPTESDPHWNHSRYAIVKAAMELGCRRIGSYADGSLHLDMSHDQRPPDVMWRVVNP